MKTRFLIISISSLFVFIFIECSGPTYTLGTPTNMLCGKSYVYNEYIYHTRIELLSFLTWNNTQPVTAPTVQGGIDSLLSKIKYPEIAKMVQVHGIVICEFLITKNGDANNFNIVKGLGAGCDESVIEALKQSEFYPAENNGEKIDQSVRVAINFLLQAEEKVIERN